MCQSFVHLHNHTEYSLLDGANRISQMIKTAKEDLEMEALAISDHGVMFGVAEFAMKCQKAKLKPIIGVEAYMAAGDLRDHRPANKSYFHLLLLAENMQGYRNLCKLSTVAALEGFYHKPRIDRELLAAHSEGVIATSACLGSEICQALLQGNLEEAEYIAGWYKEIFGPERFFIELQDHGLKEQRDILPHLLNIAKKLRLKTIATNDAHYLCQADAKPHDVLLCIGTGSQVADEKRMRFETNEFYLKSKQEMAELFRDYPEALENTAMIAERCNVTIAAESADMPPAQVPEGLTDIQYLRELAEKGLRDRCKNPEQALDRLNYELGVIEKTGYPTYFLLVREFAQATRDRGIFFGVRGSAAGSLVSYCVGITDVDPVEYDLTFERFLNPERISMPDIDMDFEDARRDEIIQYVTDRFGKDHVAQIVTFGTLGAKAALKDCGRVMGLTPQETDRITKTIPTIPATNLEKAYKEIPEFRQIIEENPVYRELYDTALRVEGLARNPGVHAAGVVISRAPLVEYLPLYRGTEGQAVTAFEMKILEDLKMLKMDFLGLSNLTVLARAVENINRARGYEKLPDGSFRPRGEGKPKDPVFQMSDIPLDDPAAFEPLARGETTGIFQMESAGMTKWVMQLKPNSVKELAAMIALFRPGPMEHIPQYIDTKFGRQAPQYLHEKMRPILEETYGVIVYQDQVLKLVQALAGFSLGKADILRRAMGKKDAGAMAKMKVEFVDGAAANGIDEACANQVWELLLPFAGYAFNKAHAVCYSLLAYQTAYLKAHYPVEYMAGLLSAYLSKDDKVVNCIEECRRKHIEVLPPCVNSSMWDFSIETVGKRRAIRFGLGAIKGVGSGVVNAIIEERASGGSYTHLYEFCERLKPQGINRAAVEALVRAGALSSINPNRMTLLEHTEAAMQFADQKHRERLSGQDNLFGDAGSKVTYPNLPEVPIADRTALLAMEQEVMGVYVSDHPLRGYEYAVRRASTHTCSSVKEGEEGTAFRVAGVITKLIRKRSQKGADYARFTLEDFTGQVEISVYGQTYERLRQEIAADRVVVVQGLLRREDRSEGLVLQVQRIEPLDEEQRRTSTGPTCVLTLTRAKRSQLEAFRRLLHEFPGDATLLIRVMPESEFPIFEAFSPIDPSPAFLQAAERILPNSRLELLSPEFA